MLKFKVKFYENDKELCETGVVKGRDFSEAMNYLEDYYGETIDAVSLKWIDIEGDVITETEAEEIFAELIERKAEEKAKEKLNSFYDLSTVKPSGSCNCKEEPIASFSYGTIN